MTTPRAPRTRTTPNPAEPLTKLKIELPAEGVETEVTQNADGSQSFSFPATVKPNETQIQDDDIDLSDIFNNSESEAGNSIREIPKTPLEKMFDDLRYGVQKHNVPDQFFASITRLPDSMTDKFVVPCRDQIPGFVVQFNTSDQFNFIPALQEVNGGSGGRFNIRVYDINQQPLEIPNPLTFERTLKPIVLGNLFVPNPPPKPITENTQNPNSAFMAYLEKLEERQRQFEQRMIDANRKPEKTTLEIAMEQKMVDLIFNGQQNNNNGIENALTSMVALPLFAQKMTERMFPEKPEPPAQHEPNGWDRAMSILDSPAGAKLADKLGNVLEMAPAALLSRGTPSIQMPPSSQQPQQQNPMNEPNEDYEPPALIDVILDELDSENPIDANNVTLQGLATQFPAESAIVTSICKSMAFDAVAAILQDRYPYAFEDCFVMVSDPDGQQQAALNPLGQRRMKRLQEFYSLVRNDGKTEDKQKA